MISTARSHRRTPLSVKQKWIVEQQRRFNKGYFDDYWVTRTRLLAVRQEIINPIGKYSHLLEYFNTDGTVRLAVLLRSPDPSDLDHPYVKENEA